MPERLTQYRRIAVFGGVYSNAPALRATLDDARRRDVDALFCLGDLGGFGPHPDRVFPLLRQAGVQVLQGNYDESLASGRADCACGYTDPRDNHYAQISYDYTFAKTADEHKRWMGTLPTHIRFEAGGKRFLLVHGSPRRINEFLWRSTSPAPFLEKLCADHDADVIVCTHTGIHWHQALPSGRHVINAGVLGRPANDGTTNVWYTLVESCAGALTVEHVPVPYDHHRLAAEMRAEKLPEEFVETVLTGWWTTCLEILPAKERAAGRY